MPLLSDLCSFLTLHQAWLIRLAMSRASSLIQSRPPPRWRETEIIPVGGAATVRMHCKPCAEHPTPDDSLFQLELCASIYADLPSGRGGERGGLHPFQLQDITDADVSVSGTKATLLRLLRTTWDNEEAKKITWQAFNTRLAHRTLWDLEIVRVIALCCCSFRVCSITKNMESVKQPYRSKDMSIKRYCPSSYDIRHNTTPLATILMPYGPPTRGHSKRTKNCAPRCDTRYKPDYFE